jgi:hypothetical protein
LGRDKEILNGRYIVGEYHPDVRVEPFGAVHQGLQLDLRLVGADGRGREGDLVDDVETVVRRAPLGEGRGHEMQSTQRRETDDDAARMAGG